MDLFIIQYEDPPRPEDGAIQITLQAIFPKGEEYQMQPGDVYPRGGRVVAKIYTDDVDIDEGVFELLEDLLRSSMRTSAKNADSLGKAFLHVVKEAYENGFHNGLNRHKEYTDRGFDCSESQEYGTLFPLRRKKKK